MPKEYADLQISKEIYEKIREKLEKSRPRVPISSYVEHILMERLEMDEALQKHGPFLSYAGNNENTIFVNDWKEGRIAAVRVQLDEKGWYHLFCELDQSDKCLHVGFVSALPEFYSILKERLGSVKFGRK